MIGCLLAQFLLLLLLQLANKEVINNQKKHLENYSSPLISFLLDIKILFFNKALPKYSCKHKDKPEKTPRSKDKDVTSKP